MSYSVLLISRIICLEYCMNLLLVAMLIQQPHQTNPVRIVSSAAFRLYQTLISPSQGDVCNFSPSCSHFAKESIEEYGILWGSLMASDRLLRCNPWAFRSFDSYYTGIENHKIHDPVYNNFILGTIKKENRHHWVCNHYPWILRSCYC